MFYELDESAVKELATAIARGDRDAAFVAFDIMIRDLTDASVIRHWIACARDVA